MKFLNLIAVLVLASLVSIQFGSTVTIAQDHPEHPTKPDHPEHPKNATATEQATALFERVHVAYKSATSISEVVTMEIPASMGSEPETM